MTKVFQVLAGLLGILSFTSLTRTAFDIGLTEALSILLTYYDTFLDRLTGWLEPIILFALSPLANMLNVEFELNPYWKHIAVVMAVYLGSNLRHIWLRGTKNAKIVNTISAVVITVICGLSSGIVSTGQASQMLIATIPIAGLAIFAFVFDLRLVFDLEAFGRVFAGSVVSGQPIDALVSWKARFRKVNKHSFYFISLFAFLGLVAFVFGIVPPPFDRAAFPGVAIFVAFIVLLSVYMLLHTVARAFLQRNSAYPTVFRQIMADGTTRVTGYMLTTIFGTAGFLFFNAGLKALGL